MIGQGELRTPHAAREHKQKLYVPPSGDIIRSSWESVRTLLRITRIAHRKSYLVIICPNSHANLTKSETRRLCVLSNTKLYHQNLLL